MLKPYRPRVNPAVFFQSVRSGLTVTEAALFTVLRTNEKTLQSSHGLFHLTVHEICVMFDMKLPRVQYLLKRLNETCIDEQPCIIYDYDLMFIPIIPVERDFYDAFDQRTVERSLKAARRKYQDWPTSVIETGGKLVNIAYTHFEQTHAAAIAAALKNNEEYANKKRGKRDENNGNKSGLATYPTPNFTPLDEIGKIYNLRVFFYVRRNSRRVRSFFRRVRRILRGHLLKSEMSAVISAASAEFYADTAEKSAASAEISAASAVFSVMSAFPSSFFLFLVLFSTLRVYHGIKGCGVKFFEILSLRFKIIKINNDLLNYLCPVFV